MTDPRPDGDLPATEADEVHQANPGFARAQLQRALTAAATDPDPKVRARAATKVDRGTAVLDGMRLGALTIGSRRPTPDLPTWVTLEIAHGGFATGRALAALPLDDTEQALLRLHAPQSSASGRAALNSYWLSDAGLSELQAAVEQGRYRIRLPEDAALPTVGLLLARGRREQALDLLAELSPYLGTLRLTPQITGEPVRCGQTVYVRPVGEVADQLAALKPPAQLIAMHQALRVWGPLYDELVSLWAATVDGDLPTLVEKPGVDREQGGSALAVRGGWPCGVVPEGWAARREQWLRQFTDACTGLSLDPATVTVHGLTTAPAAGRGTRGPTDTAEPAPVRSRYLSRDSNFSWMAQALQAADAGGFEALTGRQVGQVRRALAGSITRHGAPGSEQRAGGRAAQQQVAARPLLADVGRVLATRLARFDRSGGLPSLDAVSAPVTSDELASVAEEQPVPEALLGKLERAVEAPVAELVERGIITSGEVLAKVLPQVTAQYVAAGFADQAVTELFARTYTAFRRRRSLLLLNLEQQVRLQELPWIQALDSLRPAPSAPVARSRFGPGRGRQPANLGAATAEQAGARQALREVVLLDLRAFPGTLLPNPLVRELGALATRAGLQLPLVEEVAADIFMGTFTPKWRNAARVASTMLQGSLYARYYDLPDAGAWLKDGERAPKVLRWGRQTADDFTALCQRRAVGAGYAGATGWSASTANNGTVLEQSQVLTTHNLAVLVDELALTGTLSGEGAALAATVLSELVRTWSRLPSDWHPRLITVKNSAYALRQALFLLSLAPQREQGAVLDAFAEQVQAANTTGQALRPVAAGLLHVADGGRFDEHGRGGQGQRLYGWSVGTPWLLDGLSAPET